MGRLSQSCFTPDELRLHIYADDPCAVVRGTKAQRDRRTAVVLWVWLILGFGLALHKGQYGSSVVWIGSSITLYEDRVVASIKQSFLDHFRDFTNKLAKKNLVGTQELAKYAGQANHVAGMLFAWRPFLDALWAALHPPGVKKTSAPKRVIWRKQIQMSLDWLQHFLKKCP